MEAGHDARRDSEVPPDVRPPPDAGPDAAPNPHVIVLPPTGQNDIVGFTNAGYIVTWAERVDPVNSFDVFYFHVLDRMEHNVTNREDRQYSPDVHGRELVYDNGREILLYTLDTGIETQMTTDPPSAWRVKFNRD